MFSAVCTICGKGKVVEKEEENHVTYVVGIKMVLPEAIVGTCDTCGAVNYAFRTEVKEPPPKTKTDPTPSGPGRRRPRAPAITPFKARPGRKGGRRR